MPKQLIDYSNTIIYKIVCNDININDIYVGHTTNFIKRKYQHKILCNSDIKSKLYDTIRKNGGWDNWSMIKIAKYNCQDAIEARIREQEHFDLLNPTLNSINPITSNKYSILTIDNTIKIEDNQKDNTSNHKFECEICNFFCSKRSNYESHLLTRKHKMRTNLHIYQQKQIKKCHNIVCNNCEKTFNSRSGLWYHAKKCQKCQKMPNNINHDDSLQITQGSQPINDTKALTELVLKLVEQNKELTKQIIEISQTPTTQVNNNNINSNNKFNLNVFLNEKCKNAVNISDFVDSLVVSIKDLEETARVGYVEGISKIFINALKRLDIYERPVHCSDLKREILYVKDKNRWEREDEEKNTLTNAIKSVAHKNIQQIATWQKLHPDYSDPESKTNDKYMKIIYEAMSGDSVEEQQKNYSKVIKNITKEVVIDKN